MPMGTVLDTSALEDSLCKLRALEVASMPSSGQTLKKPLQDGLPAHCCAHKTCTSPPQPTSDDNQRQFSKEYVRTQPQLQGWCRPLIKNCSSKNLLFTLQAMKRLAKHNFSFCSTRASVPGVEGFFIDTAVKSA